MTDLYDRMYFCDCVIQALKLTIEAQICQIQECQVREELNENLANSQYRTLFSITWNLMCVFFSVLVLYYNLTDEKK